MSPKPHWGLPWWLRSLKQSACNGGDLGLIPGLRRSPGEKWQPTPVFLPEKLHGQRTLVGYSPQGHKELDITMWLILSLSSSLGKAICFVQSTSLNVTFIQNILTKHSEQCLIKYLGTWSPAKLTHKNNHHNTYYVHRNSVIFVCLYWILEWVAMPSSGGPSQPKDWTHVSHIAVRFFTIWATKEAQEYWRG